MSTKETEGEGMAKRIRLKRLAPGLYEIATPRGTVEVERFSECLRPFWTITYPARHGADDAARTLAQAREHVAAWLAESEAVAEAAFKAQHERFKANRDALEAEQAAERGREVEVVFGREAK